MSKPKIAIVSTNTLEAIGLSSIIERMMPMADVNLFSDDSKIEDPMEFFHFFVSAETLMHNGNYWKKMAQKTIVMVGGITRQPLQGFRTLDITKNEELLVKDILLMAQRGHTQRGEMPESVKLASLNTSELQKELKLTARDSEVLTLVVKGYLNKEIADMLEIGLSTVISHRKNLTRKLGVRSVGALTIYAVTHGYIKAEEI